MHNLGFSSHKQHMSALTRSTHLQHLQFLQALLHQLLYFALVALDTGSSKSVSCPSLGILAEVVGGKLAALAHEGTEERSGLVGRGVCGHRRWEYALSVWLVTEELRSSIRDGRDLSRVLVVLWEMLEIVGVNVARINLRGGGQHDGWKSDLNRPSADRDLTSPSSRSTRASLPLEQRYYSIHKLIISNTVFRYFMSRSIGRRFRRRSF